MEEEEEELTQAKLDELTASLSTWRLPELLTFHQQLEWSESQDIQILKKDREPTLNDYSLVYCNNSLQIFKSALNEQVSSYSSQTSVFCFDSMACNHDIR
jgi:hypothetical protein